MTAAVKTRDAARAAAVKRALDASAQRPDNRYRPKFPTTDLLSASASMFDKKPYWFGEHGPIARIEIGPGVVAISRKDYAKAWATRERAHEHREKETKALANWLTQEGRFPRDRMPSREIVGWSRKSRTNMRKTIGNIDWSEELSPERAPAMVTLTYPGDWLACAPDGKTSKRHLKQFKKAYKRAWGHKIAGFWKLEFHRRGAPHYHIFMVCPRGRSKKATEVNGHWIAPHLPWKMWLSLTWASCINPPDPEEYQRSIRAGTGVDYAKGLKGRDPRRISEYFVKEAGASAKAYQNIVPPEWQEPGKGPGRFWGYWQVYKRVYGVELPERDAIALSRTMRRWFRAKGAAATRLVPRVAGGRPWPVKMPGGRQEVIGLAGAQLVESQEPAKMRRARRRINRMHHRGGAGWVSVNDGANFASQLARCLDVMHAQEPAEVPRALRRAARPEHFEPPPEPLICRECGEPLAPELTEAGVHILPCVEDPEAT